MKRSLSALDRLRVCPGSGVLPAVAHRGEAADVGSAVHDWIHTAVVEGTREANASRGAIADAWELSEAGRIRFHRIVDALEECPAPAVAQAEIPLALLEDGAVVPIEGGHGSYPEIPGLVLPGTIDAVWCERDGEPVEFEVVDGKLRCPKDAVLWVVDWKTGQDEYVTPIRYNWQLRGAAILAARYFGATSVIVAIGFCDEWGLRWEVRTDAWNRVLPMTLRELHDAERDAREIIARIAKQDPAKPEVVRSEHCRFCDARIACPAFVAAPRAMVTAVPDPKAGPLTSKRAVELLPLVMQTKRAVEIADAALKDHAREEGPIPLPGGKVWGPQDTVAAEIDTWLAFPIVAAAAAAIIGDEKKADELAHRAFRATKAAVREVLGEAIDEENARRKQAGERRLKKGETLNTLFNALLEAGAMTETLGEEFGAYWPEER